MQRPHLLIATVPVMIALALSACGGDQPSEQSADTSASRDAPAESSGPVSPPQQSMEGASVQLAATQGHTANGSLSLSESPDGVRISGTVQGLAPDAQFGFHIHEKGDCSAPDASSAGGHFNPDNQPHGDPTGAAAHHAGDMVNLQSNAEGVAQVDTTVRGVSLHAGGGTDVIGKAIVVHEKADDYSSQPSGNSGSRIACGVIAVGSNATG